MTTSVSMALGALVGLGAWILWAAVLPSLPTSAAFAGTLAIFVLGPGAAIAVLLARGTSLFERCVVAMGAGLFASSALAQLLGAMDLEAAFPYVAAFVGGGALGCAFSNPTRSRPAASWRDAGAFAIAGSLALAAGTIAYAHRLGESADGVTFYGDYDTYDSSYYAAISAELTHQIPPRSLFHAGHGLGYAYHSQLLLAMVHRFGEVPLLDIYFRYAWPAFLLIASFTTYVVVRRLTSTGVALFTVCLVFFGSDLSWIAARLRPPYAEWDRIIWSTNWLTPGAELLYFNTWTPTLPILLLGFWFLDRHQDDPRTRWLVSAGACFASLLMFKPFAFGPVLGGLAAAAVLPADNASRRRYLFAIAASLVLSIPYLYLIRTNYEESQAVLRLGVGYLSVLPERVVTKVGLQRPIAQISELLGGGSSTTTVVSVIVGNLIYLVGGFGVRLLGLAGVWRSVRRPTDRAVWRVLAWTVVAGVLVPLAIVTEPYHQTFDPAHTSLLLLWIFTARELFDWTRKSIWLRVLLMGIVLVLAVPSTVHFLRLKWTDLRFGTINRDSLTIAEELAKLDFNRTVILQRYPQGPSFVAILAERRTVLAWSHYRRGSEPLAREIDAFFHSAKGDAAAAWQTLTRNRVTHVVETAELDQIHPAVLCRLRLVRATESLKLYEVPATDPGPCPGGTGSGGTGSAGPGSAGPGSGGPVPP